MFASSQYAGIMCIEPALAYETREMLNYRTWQIAKDLSDIRVQSGRTKTPLSNAIVHHTRNMSHLKSCSYFYGCAYAPSVAAPPMSDPDKP